MLSRLVNPERASVEWHPLDPRRFWLDADIGSSTRAGVLVSPESSLSLPALFRAIDNMCSHLAMLPIHVMERVAPKRVERRADHPAEQLLNNEANPEMTAFALRRSMHLHAMLWGNGRAEIERTTTRRPLWLWLLTPDRTETRRTPEGNLVHTYRSPGGMVDIPAEDIVHITNLSYDGIVGYRLIDRLAKENIGLALAIESYAQSFFGNNTILGTVFESTMPMTREIRADLEAKLAAKHDGPAKAFTKAILPFGMKATKLGAQNDHSQLVESITLTIQDAARWTNVPPPMLMDMSRATFSNITELGRWYVIYAHSPWFKQYEQELARRLFTASERARFFLRFVPEAFLRGDMEKRNAAHAVALQNGWKNIDEVRDLEDLNPLPEGLGASYRVAVNTMPITNVAEAAADDDQEPPTEPGNAMDGGRTTAAFMALAADIAARVLAKEVKAVSRMDQKSPNDEVFVNAITAFFEEQLGYLIAALAPAIEMGCAARGLAGANGWRAVARDAITERIAGTIGARGERSLRDYWSLSERTWPADVAARLWAAMGGVNGS